MLDSLNRGLEIMKYIVINRCASVSEIAQVFDINKSTASRILSVLASHNLISKDEKTMKYYSSVGTLLFSARTMSTSLILDELRPLLRTLAEAVNMTAQVGVFKQGGVFLIDQVKSASNRFLKEPAFPGMEEPLHCTALGKCVLAYMPEEQTAALMKDYVYTKYTDATITCIDQLNAEMELIRQNGYARDMGEYSAKVYCMAVPVYDKDGGVKFSLGVSGNRLYLENERVFQQVLKKVQKTSEQINGKYSASDI